MGYETYECQFGCGYSESAGKRPHWRQCPKCHQTKRGGVMRPAATSSPSSSSSSTRCSQTTKAGTQCKLPAKIAGLCPVHAR